MPPRRAANGLTEYVIRTRQPLLIARNVNQKVQELGVVQIGQPTRCWLGVPMLSGDHPENQQLVTLAHSSETRLLKMINSLLDISRLEAGQMLLNRQPAAWSWLAQREHIRVYTAAGET